MNLPSLPIRTGGGAKKIRGRPHYFEPGLSQRCKKVGKTLQKRFSPNLEKALMFLDDKRLLSTSNAVERGYRRHCRMQKTVYRVRTLGIIVSRSTMDTQREERTAQRGQTTKTVHDARARKTA